MVFKFKSLVLAAAAVLIAAPAFAQVPPAINPLGIDLDPLHIFTPVPTPPPPPAPMPMKHKKHKMMMKKKMMKKS